MESRARYFLAAKEIPEVGGSMGKKDEILGRLSRIRHFALLGTRSGQIGFPSLLHCSLLKIKTLCAFKKPYHTHLVKKSGIGSSWFF
jgi:hypothetical protein